MVCLLQQSTRSVSNLLKFSVIVINEKSSYSFIRSVQGPKLQYLLKVKEDLSKVLISQYVTSNT